MTDNANIPQLERVVFFPGQQLTAGDLTAANTATRELAWLHNRSLHAWGIGIGFEVTGQRGDSAVTIGSGYGVDCLGHEIISTEARSKVVPAVAGTPGNADAVYYLVAVYRPDAEQDVTERRPGVCLPGGTVRLGEEPLFDWRKPNELQEGRELILARASVRNCQLSGPLSLAERRYARPSQQPYVAAGQTQIGKTAWKAWKTPTNKTIGVTTEVDTSGGGFRTTPTYSAHVAGDRYLDTSPGPLLLVGYAAIVGATSDRFTMQVLLPKLGPSAEKVNPPLPADPKGVLDTLKWHVVWIGIEG